MFMTFSTSVSGNTNHSQSKMSSRNYSPSSSDRSSLASDSFLSHRWQSVLRQRLERTHMQLSWYHNLRRYLLTILSLINFSYFDLPNSISAISIHWQLWTPSLCMATWNLLIRSNLLLVQGSVYMFPFSQVSRSDIIFQYLQTVVLLIFLVPSYLRWENKFWPFDQKQMSVYFI